MKIQNLRPYILFLFCATLFDCTGVEGPEYNVPLRKKIQSASIELGENDSPIIIANLALNYGTKAKLTGYESNYQAFNTESISLTQSNGIWKTFSFRNLASYWSSRLFRKNSGEVYALVPQFNRSQLYSFKNSDWILIASANEIQSVFYPGNNSSSTPFFIYNDTAWQYFGDRNFYAHKFLISNRGTEVLVDTNSQSSPELFNNGKDFNLIISKKAMNDSNGQYTFQIVYYTWPADSINAKPTTQILLNNQIGNNRGLPLLSATIAGETRYYFPTQSDSLLEFTLQNRTLIQTGMIHFASFTINPNSSTYNYSPAVVGPDRCIYRLEGMQNSDPSFDTSTNKVYPTHSSYAYLYHSSCNERYDTLSIPIKTHVEITGVETSKILFGKNGLPMILFTISAQESFGIDTQNQASNRKDLTVVDLNALIGPSWLYLAKLTSVGKWEWEQIAEY